MTLNDAQIALLEERYLAKGSRLTIGVLDPDDSFHFLSLSGTATLVTDGAQIDRLAKKYFGVDEYPWRDPADTRVTVLLDVKDVIHNVPTR